MAIFDQRNQKVKYQYNSAGNINLDNLKDKSELINELRKIKEEIGKAIQANAVDEDNGIDAEYQITKAIREAEKPTSDKKSFLDHIGKAKDLLGDAKAAVDLVTALMQASVLAQSLF